MAKFGDSGELLKCSFCGKSQKQVKKLIAVQVCTSATSASTFATKSLKKNSANPLRFPSTIFQAHEKFRVSR